MHEWGIDECMNEVWINAWMRYGWKHLWGMEEWMNAWMRYRWMNKCLNKAGINDWMHKWGLDEWINM